MDSKKNQPAIDLDSLEKIDRAVFQLFQTMKNAIADVRAAKVTLAELEANPRANREEYKRLRRELEMHRDRVAKLKSLLAS